MFGFKKEKYIVLLIFMRKKKIVFLFKPRKRFAFDFVRPKNAIHFPSLAFILKEHIIFSEVIVLQSKESGLCPSYSYPGESKKATERA